MSEAVIRLKIGVWERKVSEHKRVIGGLRKELDKVSAWLAEDEAKLATLREKLSNATANEELKQIVAGHPPTGLNERI